MPISLSLSELMDYTDWERRKWYEWLRRHGDGRFQTVGELLRHIFSAEKRNSDTCEFCVRIASSIKSQTHPRPSAVSSKRLYNRATD